MTEQREMSLDSIRNELLLMAKNGGDNEVNHGRADDLLCMALQMLGRGDIAQAFEQAAKEFWYA